MAERKSTTKKKGFGTILGALLVKTYLGRMVLTLVAAAVVLVVKRWWPEAV